MAIERYGSKTDVVVKLVLVFFVCLLSFSVGTFVGKKFSDNQHRLAQFEPASAEREIASVATPGETPTKTGETLSDEEIAKLAEEFVNEDEVVNSQAAVDKTDAKSAHSSDHKSAHSADHKPEAKVERSVAEAKPDVKHDPSHDPKHVAPKPLPVAEKIAHGKDPHAVTPPAAPKKGPANAEATVTLKADTEKKPVPTSLPQDVAASAIGKYTVQVASYPSEAEATKMTENLKGQGFGAFYIKADIVDKKTSATKTWYRVSVGLFQTQKEADAYKADLISRSKVTSALVQKVTK